MRSAVPTAWVPRSKPIWFTELGCAAIDKGTNQPNRFLDPKSSESGLPHFSSGARDDLIQVQYLRAMTSYWGAPENNPVSPLYGGAMVDMDNAHVWAWDARPFPRFPGASDLWSDAGNYARGHWLNGRMTAQSLAAVVREICAQAGLADVDVAELYGLLRGYVVDRPEDARAALQPLMLAYGFEAAERGGTLRFGMRRGRPVRTLDPAGLAVTSETEGDIVRRRSAEAEMAGRVRLTYVTSERDYETRAAEAVLPGDPGAATSRSELPLCLTAGEAVAVVERWLAEARVARETLSLALPPSASDLGAGDVFALQDGDPEARYRVDRVEVLGPRLIEATRIEDHVYVPAPSEGGQELPSAGYAPPLPVDVQFLDLPLLSGDEVPHAPHVAAVAAPWPGPVTVQGSSTDAGYAEEALLERASVMGVSLSPLGRAEPGAWDRGSVLRVRMLGGSLSSASREAVLNGANALAIGDGSPENWEILQFRDAVLVAPDTFDLSLLLRGQQGTDAILPELWPAGSRVVLLSRDMQQLDLPQSLRGVERHYRVGPASQPIDSASFTHLAAAFRGVGLRPYAPCHLRFSAEPAGLAFTWIRRTRIDGDGWDGVDVPLGEDREAYLVRVVSGGVTLREEQVTEPAWLYTTAARASDAPSVPFEIHVAQLSDRFGPGPFLRSVIDV